MIGAKLRKKNIRNAKTLMHSDRFKLHGQIDFIIIQKQSGYFCERPVNSLLKPKWTFEVKISLRLHDSKMNQT